ncbi:MAG: hypothetical protein MZV70_49805 [Desulfobacterales bacterium]|nr:hypothetical protein [Desulfobacterales bacterium]
MALDDNGSRRSDVPAAQGRLTALDSAGRPARTGLPRGPARGYILTAGRALRRRCTATLDGKP